jgi:hypothetical protein
MSIFKEESETKRVIFNVEIDLAKRLETAKKNARTIGKKLDVDTAVNKALEKFLKKAEKKIYEVMKKQGLVDPLMIRSQENHDDETYAADFDEVNTAADAESNPANEGKTTNEE